MSNVVERVALVEKKYIGKVEFRDNDVNAGQLSTVDMYLQNKTVFFIYENNYMVTTNIGSNYDTINVKVTNLGDSMEKSIKIYASNTSFYSVIALEDAPIKKIMDYYEEYNAEIQPAINEAKSSISKHADELELMCEKEFINFIKIKCKNLFLDIDNIVFFQTYVFALCRNVTFMPSLTINNEMRTSIHEQFKDKPIKDTIIDIWKAFQILWDLTKEKVGKTANDTAVTWIAFKRVMCKYYGEVWKNEHPSVCTEPDMDILTQKLIHELGDGGNKRETLLFTYYLMAEKSLTNEPIEQIYQYIGEIMQKEYDKQQKEDFIHSLSKDHVDVGLSPDIEIIDGMTGIEFEQLLSDVFTRKGYRVEMTKASGDQGIDLIAEKGRTRLGIQTKRYTGFVGNSAIQEVIAGMEYYKLNAGMVITSSYYTPSAYALAQSANIILWDRDKLISEL